MNYQKFVELYGSEEKCEVYLRSVNKKNLSRCPHCYSSKIIKLNTRGIVKCAVCKKQISIRINTIFENSKVPLYKWFAAIYICSKYKNGATATELSKSLGISQKTTWTMVNKLKVINNL